MISEEPFWAGLDLCCLASQSYEDPSLEEATWPWDPPLGSFLPIAARGLVGRHGHGPALS